MVDTCTNCRFLACETWPQMPVSWCTCCSRHVDGMSPVDEGDD